jgi:MoaA/NifB/PqqE/SkfB family radical SAM enzyme
MKVFDQAIAEIMPTFCAIPFVSLMVNPDATVKPCCMMKKGSNTLHNEDGSVATIKNDFKKLWNSDKLKKIRIDMVSGNKVSGCEVCYLQEDSGRKSNRQQSNEEWAFKLGTDHLYKLMDRAIIKNGELDYSIAYLDLRLGNLCNLKCRMCSPWNSSQIAKEHLDLQNRDKEYKLVWDKSFGRFNKEFLDVQQLFEEDILWDQIIDLIPKLHKVWGKARNQ